MSAAKGNTYAVKLKDNNLKIEAYKDYCAHLAAGKGRKGWRWRKDDRLLCTYLTIEKWIKEEPEVFNSIQKEIALCDGYDHWEAVVAASAKGENEKANTASLQMIMRNMHGWDVKDEKSTSVTVNIPDYNQKQPN